MGLKLFGIVVLAAASLFPDPSAAGQETSAAEVIGSRLVALELISTSCADTAPAKDAERLAHVRESWLGRNVEYVKAMRVYYAFMAGTFDKERAGDGARTLEVLRGMLVKRARPLVKPILGKVSDQTCATAIDKIDGGELDIAKAPQIADADWLRRTFGPLFVADQPLTFDVQPLLDPL